MKIAFRTFSQWWEEKQIRLQRIPFLPRTFESFVVLMTTQPDLSGCMWLAICLCAASKIEGDIHRPCLDVIALISHSFAFIFLCPHFFLSDRHDLTDSWFATCCNPSLVCAIICLAAMQKPSSWFRIPTELHPLDSGTLRELKSAFPALLWDSCSFSRPSPAVPHAPTSSVWVFANLNKQFSNYLHQAFYVD